MASSATTSPPTSGTTTSTSFSRTTSRPRVAVRRIDFGDPPRRSVQALPRSSAYRDHFRKAPVICLSVRARRSTTETANVHPILGVEYRNDDTSPTDRYFAKMGMKVRYLLQCRRTASRPWPSIISAIWSATYHQPRTRRGSRRWRRSPEIYRPEIYNANSVAAEQYRPPDISGLFADPSSTIARSAAGSPWEQGQLAEAHIIARMRCLRRWSATSALISPKRQVYFIMTTLLPTTTRAACPSPLGSLSPRPCGRRGSWRVRN